MCIRDRSGDALAVAHRVMNAHRAMLDALSAEERHSTGTPWDLSLIHLYHWIECQEKPQRMLSDPYRKPTQVGG